MMIVHFLYRWNYQA